MRITEAPEFDIVVYYFQLHFVWELFQAPRFSSLDSVSHWQGVMICLQATIGDVLIALVAFWAVAVISLERRWIKTATTMQAGLFLLIGIFATMAIEFYSTEIALRWTYAKNMPRLPALGTGLSPLLQWVFIPLVVLWLIRRRERA